MSLVLRDVTGGYGNGDIVNAVSLKAENEVFAVLGRNGMGKTTLTRAIMGYLPRSQGTIEILGESLRGRPVHDIVRRGVVYAPQEGHLFDELTVDENLEVGLGSTRGRSGDRSEVYEYFPVLRDRLQQRAGTLSGGEQKMLVLARAILERPRVLIIDEISAGLQPAVVSAVTLALKTELAKRELTVLMVEQNVDMCLDLADTVAVMALGSLRFQAAADEPDIRDRLRRELAP